MAIQPYVKVETQWGGESATLYRWNLKAQNDTGAPVRIPLQADITVSVRGTIATGSGQINMEGTLDDSTVPATASYGILHKVDLSNINLSGSGALAAALLVQVLEHPLQIRPNQVTGDGGTNSIVEMIVVKQWKN